MAKVDLVAACGQHFQCYQGDLNLNNIKLTASNMRWEDKSFTVDSQRGATRKLQVNYKPHQRELYSDVETTKVSEIVTSVNIATGVVIGTNRKLRLPLTTAPPQVRNALGDFVDIDPGKQFSEKSDKLTLTLGSAHQMTSFGGATAAQATVTVKDDRYTCNFSCTVTCKGTAIHNHHGAVEQDEIAQIILDLQQTSNVYSHITVNTNNQTGLPDSISFPMTGQCEFSGQFEQTIDWQ
ncbi:uncharacterized protein LOC131935848 [Physella acuta]|uniref:uncharacterized protein LOC131935848 n=1 Tax=Physella acuta TaxID=109671 RepID=UPI0027DD1C73|nr:uncharacterized protein LOC131935848 [Physella acuta]